MIDGDAPSAHDSSWHWGGFPLAAVLALALLVGVEAGLLALRSSEPIGFNLNEGWNLYWAGYVSAGANPYDEAGRYTVLNYPPVSFYLVSWLGRVVGSNLTAGRILSWASALAVCALAGASLPGVGRAGRFFAGVSLLAVLIGQADAYIGAGDPQMLGQAFSMLALCLFLRLPEGAPALLLAAAMVAASLTVKHNLVAVPATVCLALALRAPRRAVLFGLACALLSALAYGAFWLSLGESFARQIALTGNRIYTARNMLGGVMAVAVGTWPLALAAAPAAWGLLKNRRDAVLPLYAAVSLGVGVFFSGGEGVAKNVFFDFYISLAMLLGCAADRLPGAATGRGRTAAILAALLPWLLLAAVLKANDPLRVVSADAPSVLREKAAAFQRGVALTAGFDDPVLCENMLTAYLADKRFSFDAFNASQLVMTRRLPEDEVVGLLRAGTFRLIQLEDVLGDAYGKGGQFPPLSLRGRFTERMLDAIASSYVLAGRAGRAAFYVPR